MKNIKMIVKTIVKTMNVALFLFALMMFGSCALSKADDDTVKLFARSHGLYVQGMLRETIDMLLPKNTGGKAQHFVPLLILRGKSEYFLGNINDAEKTMRRVLRLKRGHTEATLYLARIYREKNKSGEAQKIIEGLLANDPSNIQALRLAAELARDRGPEGERAAMAFLDRAADASTESAFVFLDRARLYWIAGNAEEALRDVRCARALVRSEEPISRSIDNLEKIIIDNL